MRGQFMGGAAGKIFHVSRCAFPRSNARKKVRPVNEAQPAPCERGELWQAKRMNAQAGSAGNVIAALCSFLFPGLGQLVQGRVLAALLHFVLAGALWLISFGFLGWLGHVISAVEAARWKPRAW